ncbi:PREDICTED: IQ domain-containing protein D [Pterocles gutturalis]|uniref:IQ domain-containing protein D n=1 Tax=Pterocles gutturalis TaxID=240206 RepID=UPI00052934A7|nr:PREDICTED: IQ domain-containing protein D [Pterocles gutturalis]
MAAPEKATTMLNAIKMSEPRQLKPNSVETERIITVLDEMIAKLELSSLVPWIIDSLDRFVDMLGPEITNKLTEHQRLSTEVRHLLASSGEENTMGTKEQWSRLCLLEQRLKCSVRNVLRLLLANPSLCQALKYEIRTRESPAEVFIKAFREFRNLMLERLLTSPVEEEEKIRFMEDLSLQIEKNTEAITALRAELAAAIRTCEEETHKKDNEIRILKSSMQELTEACKTGIQQMKEEGEKQQKEELQAARARCGRLRQDVQQLGAQLHALVLEHRESELALRKRKCRAEMEIMNWVQKYDTDMAEKQAEYEEVSAAYAKEKAQLSLLTEKHAMLLQEYSQIQEERRIRQEKEERELEELNTKTRAATCIQAFWRGYLVRSVFKPKKKKGKGKGKGKGKDKGKGKKAKK